MGFVPTDAFLAARIDLPSIAKTFKDNKKELDSLLAFATKNKLEEAPFTRLLIELAQHPEKSGIDFNSYVYAFGHKTKRGDNFGLLIRVRDKSDLSEFMKGNIPAGNTRGVESGVDYAEYNDGSYVSWNEDALLFTVQMGESRSYFASILNKKTPGAKGNLKLNRINESKALICYTANVNAMLDPENDVQKKILNLLGSETWLNGEVVTKNGEIAADISLDMAKPEKSKLSRIVYVDNKFNKIIPYLAGGQNLMGIVKMNINMTNLGEAILSLTESSYSKESAKNTLDSANKYLTGSIAFSVFYSEENRKKYKEALEQGNYEDLRRYPENPVVMAIGIKKTIFGWIEKLQKNGAMELQSDGIYQSKINNFAFTILEDIAMVSNGGAEYLREFMSRYKSHTPVRSDLLNMMDPSSPLGFVMDNKWAAANEISRISAFPYLDALELRTTMTYIRNNKISMNVSGNKMSLRILLNNSKTDPIVAFLKDLQTSMKAIKKMREERDEDLVNPYPFR